MITLQSLDRQGINQAQILMGLYHYLKKSIDARGSVEGYKVILDDRIIGWFLLGRPQATRVNGWYGDLDDMAKGRCEITRWQVLNLARVLFHPDVQWGGKLCNPDSLPGFVDRRGVWRSTLASTAIRMLMERVGYDYLIRRPPCFLDEPYEIQYLMSYCDIRLHKGTIYKASGFEHYLTKNQTIQTWRCMLPGLTQEQDQSVIEAARQSQRSQDYRAKRGQLVLDI